MIRSLYTSATGMRAQELNIDVIANNLANVNTTAFKKSVTSFQDLMYQNVLEPGAPTSQSTISPSGIQVGLGVKPSAVQKVFEQGDLTSTGNPLDVAIQGDGFFQVTLPNGTTTYSRSGNFQIDNNGQLVTPEGYTVEGGAGIPTDALSITIAEDGTLSVLTPGTTAATQVGQLTAVRFPNPTGLKPLGQNLYQETTSSGAPTTGNFGQDGIGRLSQGFLEGSNVSVVEQVVKMITAQRAYEAASKGISTSDEMLTQALNVKR